MILRLTADTVIRAIAPSRPRGLSLPEAVVIFLVFSVCVTASAVIISNQSVQWRWRLTETRMQRIDQLLQMHLAAFGRLPCPSDISRLSGDPLDGVEAASPGHCMGALPSANADDGNSLRVSGGVPYATLGLNAQDARDGWGHRITMAVAVGWTGEAANSGVGFQLRDLGDGILEDQAAIVLWSAGPDGHGAYAGKGGLARLHAWHTSPWQLENCDCDEEGRSTGLNAVFYQRGSIPEGSDEATRLDDVVRGISNAQLQRVRVGGRP